MRFGARSERDGNRGLIKADRIQNPRGDKRETVPGDKMLRERQAENELFVFVASLFQLVCAISKIQRSTRELSRCFKAKLGA